MPSSDGCAQRGATRRAVLAGSSLLLAGWPGATVAQVAARFSGTRVDTGPLAARGGGGAAELIQRIMPGKLLGVFSDLIAPGGRSLPMLVARIDTLYLAASAETPGAVYFHAQDTMTGAGLVVAGRQTQAETPLRVTLPPSYSGTWYLPDIDGRRIDSLSYQFAYWLRREMQL